MIVCFVALILFIIRNTQDEVLDERLKFGNVGTIRI